MTDSEAARDSNRKPTDEDVKIAELEARLDRAITRISYDVNVITAQLSKLHKEPLDLRARHRLKRAEQSARRIAQALKDCRDDPPQPAAEDQEPRDENAGEED